MLRSVMPQRTLQMTDANTAAVKAATGIRGLDDILAGGFAQGHLFLLEGQPGTGKTTMSIRFLMEGAARGERGLYITLSETEHELREGARSHGWDLGENIAIHEVVPSESLLDPDEQQSLLYSSELELGETTQRILRMVEASQATRVVLDSLSEIRLLAQSSLRYRRQLLALKHYFARQGATVLVLDDLTSESDDKTVHSIAHAVVQLQELAPDYGSERRRLRVLKYRGQHFRGGYHDFSIRTGDLQVYPRLVALEHRSGFNRRVSTSGIARLDSLLGGGIEQGSSTLLIGPTGTGKTTFALQFVKAATQRGEKAALFIFDEERDLLAQRMRALGIDLDAMEQKGVLHIEQVDAAEMSPGEFAHRVRQVMATESLRTVVIDSLNGYQAAMPEEKALILHVHELLQYLNRQGANTFLTVAQHGLVGDMKTPVDVTYLADTVILLRYFEAVGQVRRAVSVIKKRTGSHEDTIREYRFTDSGPELGEPVAGFQGVLRGVPNFVGTSGQSLMAKPSPGPAP
jgi:circadian clock protein KaiC